MFQPTVTQKFKTHFMFNNFFPKIYCLWDNVGKYGTADRQQIMWESMVHSDRQQIMWESMVHSDRQQIMWESMVHSDRQQIMWESMVQPDRQQMAIWSKRFACWISKATNTYWEYVHLLIFHSKNGPANASLYYVYTYIFCLVCPSSKSVM